MTISAPMTARLVSLAIVLSTSACASAGSEADPFRGGASATEPEVLTVTIRNQNFNDATIYALWSGRARQRVGTVTGNTSRTFDLEYRGDAIRFEVDFLAGGEFIGDQIQVSPGDHVEFRLPPQPG